MKCLNCGQNDSHFVPPSYGEAGFYLCAATTTPLTPMTLREQCEAFMVKFMRQVDWAGYYEPLTKEIALDKVEQFARQQQAVGLREAAEAYRRWLPSTIPKAGDWRPPLRFDEWCEQQAREREGTP